MNEQRLILYGVLDWGLGHAARSVPIIRNELQKGASVTVATSRKLYDSFFCQHFDGIEFLELPSFEPLFSKSNNQTLKLLLQLPIFVYKYLVERLIVVKWLRQNKPEMIISDNRPSCRHKTVYSVYITHQLHICNKKGDEMPCFSWVHKQLIKRYNKCLIPDFEESSLSVAGRLSHPPLRGVDCEYIGLLSRFEDDQPQQGGDAVLVLLSGPEPQRTMLENKLLQAIGDINRSFILVRGSNQPLEGTIAKNTEVYSVVNDRVLSLLFARCKKIICRSGYSTIMDLLVLGKSALLVPTPGQYEQEYLAERLKQRPEFYVVAQNEFNYNTISLFVND
jgi:uncharacterized protein (TIGR00661 family)